jgi:hypothetical protein
LGADERVVMRSRMRLHPAMLEVHRVIDDAEGRILVGSSSILTNDVPLENFLAMREAVGLN